MALRNFWMEAYVDGRETDITGGPRSRDGGMSIILRQRNEGISEKVLTISCYAGQNGELITYVEDKDKDVIHKIVTNR